MTTANVSRLAAEALVAGTPAAQVSKVAVEALYIGDPQPQVSRMAVEVLYIPGTTGTVEGAVSSPTATLSGLLSGPPSSLYPTAVLADAPAGYWRLGEASGVTTAADASGNGRTGTYSGTPIRGVAGLLAGDTDTAVTFQGSGNNQYVSVPSASWMEVTTITVECLVSTPVPTSAGVVMSRDLTGSNGPWRLDTSGSGKLIWYVWTPGIHSVVGTTTLVAGRTYHVAATYDGTTAKLYVNGVLEGSTTGGTLTTTQAQPLKIGALGSAGNFNGTIDEAAFYTTALSATRVAAHYTAAMGGPYSAAVLADAPSVFYGLNEASGLFQDSSGNARHITSVDAGAVRSLTPVTNDGGTAVSASGTAEIARWSGTTITALNAGSVSIEFWLRTPSSLASSHGTFVKIGTTGGWDVGLGAGREDQAGSRLVIGLNGITWLDTGVTLSASSTYHVVVTRSSTNVFTLYLNGAPVYTSAAQTVTTTAASQILLGDDTGGTTERLTTGLVLDNVAVYPSVLTQARASAHWSAGRAQASIATTPYMSAVLADSPAAYYPLYESSGNFADASSNGRTAEAAAGSTRGKTSLLTEGGAAVAGSGTANIASHGGAHGITMNNATVECFVKIPATSALSGGFIGFANGGWAVGFGTTRTTGGTFAGRNLVIGQHGVDWRNTGYTFPTAGGTFHVVVTWDATNTVRSYVNGSLVATNTGWGAPSASTAGIRVGEDEGSYLASTVDVQHAAFYSGVLSATQAQTHYTASALSPSGVSGALAGAVSSPTAALSGTAAAPGVNGALTGVLSSPTGAFAGTAAPPSLTGVLAGAVASPTASATGTATAPNVAPTANFTWTPGSVPGEVVFDGLSSSDPDGSIVNFAWDFGNGQTVSGAPSDWSGATVEYGSTPGSYQVHLTVTDNRGATGTVTKTVTIAAPSVTGTLTGAAPSPTATLTGPTAATGVLAGVAPGATGTIAGVVSARPARPDDWPGTSAQLDSDYTFDSEDIDSTGASLEDGEPVPAGYGRTFWWHLTPADSATMSFDLLDSAPVNFTPVVDPDTDEESEPPAVDVKVAVYTGTSVANMQLVAAGGQPGVEVALAAGVTYYVQASLRTGAADVTYQLSIGAPIDTDRYVMDLEVLSPVLRAAPTSVTVAVAGGPPNDEVTFEIDGVVTDSATLDEDGSLEANSVNVPDGYGAGEHVVSVHSTSSTLAGEDAFTLQRGPYQAQQTVGGDRPPVEIPAANTSTGVRRWIFQDLMAGGEGSYVLPRNPSEMSSPQYQRQLSQVHTTAVDGGQYHLNSIARTTVEWTFNGYLESQVEVERFQAYYGLKRRFYVIDHRSRAWIVTFLSLELTPRKRQREDDGDWNDWAHDYKVTALIYDQDWSEPT